MLAPDQFDAFVEGIARRESGGMRDPYGNITNAGRGRRVYGRYQILGDNIPAWTKEALGKPMTPQQFLASPEAQDAVARHKLGQYVQQYGPEGAAQAWLGGPGSVGKTDRRDRFGTSVGDYGRQVMTYAGLSGGRAQPAAPSYDDTAAPSAAAGNPALHYSTDGAALRYPDGTVLGPPPSHDYGTAPDTFVRAPDDMTAQHPVAAALDTVLSSQKQAPPHPISVALDGILKKYEQPAETVPLPRPRPEEAPAQTAPPSPAEAPQGAPTQQPAQVPPWLVDASLAQPAAANVPAAPPAPDAAANPMNSALGASNVGMAHNAFLNLPNILTAAGEYAVRQAGNALGAPMEAQPYSQIIQRMNAEDAAVQAQHPVANAVGTAGGIVATLPAAAAAPGAMATTLGGRAAAGAGLGGVTGAVQGFGQEGKLSGAIEGGTTGAALGGALGAAAPWAAPILGGGAGAYGGYKATDGSLLGTVGGAAAGVYGARTLGRVAAPAIRNLAGGAAGTSGERVGYDAVAKLLRQPNESMTAAAGRVRADIAEFRAANGYNPSAAQLMQREEARRLTGMIEPQPRARVAAQAAEERMAAEQQPGLERAVEGHARAPTTQSRLEERADTEMTAALDAPRPTGGGTVRETPFSGAAILSHNPDVANVERGWIMRRFNGEGAGNVRLDDALDGRRPLTVGEADEIRKLATRAARNRNNTEDDTAFFRNLAQRTAQAARAASPEYATAFDTFSTTMRRGAGADVGATNAAAIPEDFGTAVRELRRESGPQLANAAEAGVGPGLRTELSQRATGGAKAVPELSERLATESAVQRNLATALGPQEARRIQRAGEINLKAGRAAAELGASGRTTDEIKSGATEQLARLSAYGVAGHKSGVYHTIVNVAKRLRMTEGAALRLVEIASTPGGLRGVIDFMVRRGMGRREAADIARSFAAMQAGNLAGSTQVTTGAAAP